MAADVPSPTIKVSRRPDNPPVKIADMSPSELTAGGGISTKQRLGIGALAPTNPGTGPPPPPKQRPLPESRPSALIGLKIKKKIPSLSNTTDVNSGVYIPHEPSHGSAHAASVHSPHPTSNMSLNITNMTPSTSVPVSAPIFHRPPIPNGTMYVFLLNSMVYITILLLLVPLL